jgi:hypothetical protein
MTTKKRKTKKKLTGLMNSGLLFIGDPSFMMGPADPQIQSNGSIVDGTPIDPLNPFRRAEDITRHTDIGDYSLPIVEAVEGRGIVINTLLPECRYEVKKKLKEGIVTEIRIILKK